MSTLAADGARWRSAHLARSPASPSSIVLSPTTKSKSATITSPLGISHPSVHNRNYSFSLHGGSNLAHSASARHRSNSSKAMMQMSTTFAPQFIKVAEAQKENEWVGGIESENDFSGKRYVWLHDVNKAFIKGWIVEELDKGKLLVQCDDGSRREVESENADKVNPANFDKADDMAELTYLNEASVVHNLHTRYQADMIYTYSGLFLVAVNPYCSLPVYSNEYIRMYKGQSREDTKPHIYALADEAFRNLVQEGENQSILVTGESGAGKTENTKKVIQYLAAVATSDTPRTKPATGNFSNLSQQILKANPILEAFGNAQTVRNNNSSRFGKFIRIEFTRSGQIAGAFIDWYLLEKSRVIRLNSNERSYHVFYQLLKGASHEMKQDLFLDGQDVDDFNYTRAGNDTIHGVSDVEAWHSLVEAFHVMGFSTNDQNSVLRAIAVVLLLGNITVMRESSRTDQGILTKDAISYAEKVCLLLKVPVDPFIKGLLHPQVKAGKEWVEKVQTPEQVRSSLDALAKGIYERAFGDLVARINRQLDRTGVGLEDSQFIGVLDIAGFEIFENNSFEQLCINYTNEKLQQFFNHHMFVLEQEEYAREQIEWKFIDFGKDLQPTIDLIELPNPIGIFSCLDEESVMPKATDQTFTEKMHSLWENKTSKYKPSRLAQGFVLTHYAAEVEYATSGWLEKNKDPLNDNITRLLASSSDSHIATLFADCADPDDDTTPARSRVKKGLFRTVAQRHKEQLSSLMSQLQSTHPHFVRCIIPNHKKKPKQFSAPLVLDQLRCNGVLEGIRIARTGFPNRLSLSEFRQRYEVLCDNMPNGYLEGQTAVKIILERLSLDQTLYRVGLSKVFFRAGVLAELEEKRDELIRDIMSRFQSIARGFVQRRIVGKQIYQAEAARIIQQSFEMYTDLCSNSWWRLFVRMKPLLGAPIATAEIKKRDETIQKLEGQIQDEGSKRCKLEDERRRANAEAQRIQQTLESERSLAHDKEAIFRRLQTREAELTEKLSRALGTMEENKRLTEMIRKLEIKSENQDHERQILEDEHQNGAIELEQLKKILEDERSAAFGKEEMFTRLQNREAEFISRAQEAQEKLKQLETQLDRIANGKRAIEMEAEKWRTLSDRAGESIAHLESEKKELLGEISLMNTKFQNIERISSEKAKRLEVLVQENELLNNQLNVLMQQQDREAELIQKLDGAKENQEQLEDQLEAESSKVLDMQSTINLFKRRADEYFGKLEQAEVAVLQASRAEQAAKVQAREMEDAYARAVAEKKDMDLLVEGLQRQNQNYEERVDDLGADLDCALQAKKRLQHELEDYRSQRAEDIEDKETSLEQTRRKYQVEFFSLSNELEVEREKVIQARSENRRILDELEKLRSKWDDEILNSSKWAKEKSRLEATLQDLSKSMEGATNDRDEAHNVISSLQSEIRSLRRSKDEAVVERDALQKEKRRLEAKLAETGDRLDDLTRGVNSPVRSQTGIDREYLELKSHLAQQEDAAATAITKMRKADVLIAEVQKEIVAERETTANLHKEKAALEKCLKELQGRVVELETKSYSSASQDVRFLTGRVQELEHQLETQESHHASSLRSVRVQDRIVRDLQTQISRREKQVSTLVDDIAKGKERNERLLKQVDELQAEETRSQLRARRAERDLREEKEKGLRLERELEGWKGLRLERKAVGTNGVGGEWDDGGRRNSGAGVLAGSEGALRRSRSNSKGFL